MSKASDYMGRYLKITWTYDLCPYAASVQKYLTNLKNNPNYKSRIQGAQIAYQRLLQEIEHEIGKPIRGTFSIQKRAFSSGDLEASFRGKASPAMLEKTLWLATHFQFIQQKHPPKTKHHSVPATDAQSYADWYLGVDCSGFVNNFLGRRYGNHLTIDSYDSDKKTRRLSANEIQPGDLIIKWSQAEPYSHIAIVEKVNIEGEQFKVICVESSGDQGIGVTNKNIRLIKNEPMKNDLGGFPSVRKIGVRYYFQSSPASFVSIP